MRLNHWRLIKGLAGVLMTGNVFVKTGSRDGSERAEMVFLNTIVFIMITPPPKNARPIILLVG